MSRSLILTLAAAATIAVASFASSASFARGGGGGHGGGGGGGGHGGGGGGHGGAVHFSSGGHGRSGGHFAHNFGHSHREHPTRFASHGHGQRIFRNGQWIVIDSIDGDLPDAGSDASPTDQQPQAGQCLVSVYWDADFKGERWDTAQDQSYVGNHWNDQISSIRVISGTWRFYWDANYGGDTMDLKPGEYRYIDPRWNDQISSFRCIADGSAAAQ
jgi:hypothetical protein